MLFCDDALITPTSVPPLVRPEGAFCDEVDQHAKICFVLLLVVATLLTCLRTLGGNSTNWYVSLSDCVLAGCSHRSAPVANMSSHPEDTILFWRYFFRYVVLLSYIIPISLRVNLDMAKTMSANFIWAVQL